MTCDILVDDTGDDDQHYDFDRDYVENAVGNVGGQCSKKTGHCLRRLLMMKAVEHLALSLFLSFYLLHCLIEKMMMMSFFLFPLLFLMMILTLRRHYTFCYFVYYLRLLDWCRMGLFLTHECHDDSVKKQ